MPSLNELVSKNETLEDKVIEINNKKVTIKSYLPIEEKYSLIMDLINVVAQEDYHYLNTLQEDILITILIIKYYTDINLDGNQNMAEIYDLACTSGLWHKIEEAIPASELSFVLDNAYDILDNYFEYRNSALGIMEALIQNGNELNNNVEELQKNLTEGKGVEFLKEVMEKMG